MLLSQPIVILVSTCVIPHRIVLSLSSCYTKCLRKDNCEEQVRAIDSHSVIRFSLGPKYNVWCVALAGTWSNCPTATFFFYS